MIKLLILIIPLLLTGCAVIEIERDHDGNVNRIIQRGFPAKGKIGDCEIDSKMSLFDLNLNGIKNGG